MRQRHRIVGAFRRNLAHLVSERPKLAEVALVDRGQPIRQRGMIRVGNVALQDRPQRVHLRSHGPNDGQLLGRERSLGRHGRRDCRALAAGQVAHVPGQHPDVGEPPELGIKLARIAQNAVPKALRRCDEVGQHRISILDHVGIALCFVQLDRLVRLLPVEIGLFERGLELCNRLRLLGKVIFEQIGKGRLDLAARRIAVARNVRQILRRRRAIGLQRVVDELPLDQDLIDASDEAVGGGVLAGNDLGALPLIERRICLQAKGPERYRQRQRRSNRDAGGELDRRQLEHRGHPAGPVGGNGNSDCTYLYDSTALISH